MPSCKIPMAQQLRAQGNAARSLWVWLQEALKTEYPLPAECDDKTALWKSIPEACQYLWARPGMYSCNLLGPFCTQHENPHIRRCPICLERTNNFLARGCCRKTSGGGYSTTKTARNYQTEKEESLKHFKCSGSRLHEDISLHCSLRAGARRWHNCWH